MNEVFVRLYHPKEEYDRKEIYRYMQAKEPTAETAALAEECINECRDVFSYGVCYCISGVEKSGDRLTFDTFEVVSHDLSRCLHGCEKAVIFSATVGLGIDRLISKYCVVSPAKAVIFQAIGAERIEHLCDIFNDEIRLQYEKEGCATAPRFSPGYGDLSLETQRDIFNLLDCRKRIGLNLGDNLLMSPSKSVTAVIGISLAAMNN